MVGERRDFLGDGVAWLQGPGGDVGAQAAHQFVGLVEVDVVERNGNAQIAHDLDVLVGGGLGWAMDIEGIDLRERRDFQVRRRFGEGGSRCFMREGRWIRGLRRHGFGLGIRRCVGASVQEELIERPGVEFLKFDGASVADDLHRGRVGRGLGGLRGDGALGGDAGRRRQLPERRAKLWCRVLFAAGRRIEVE